MSSISAGIDFEKRVFCVLDTEIKANRFIAKPECCAVFHQKGYYSRDRLTDIKFDVAIELTLPGARSPSMFFLIECKDYDHPVPVGDVEEFHAKVQQVAADNSKAIVVSSNSFQLGAIEFARSKGIGLVRMLPTSDLKWVLLRSASSLLKSSTLSRDAEVWSGLTEQKYHSRTCDFFGATGDLLTCSLRDFFTAVTSDVYDSTVLTAIAAERSDIGVQFISADEIENRCRAIHEAIRFTGGAVSLQAVCDWQRREADLRVVTGAAAPRVDAQRGILGRTSFRPPSIVVYRDSADRRRERFTLAHELGHLLLGQGSTRPG